MTVMTTLNSLSIKSVALFAKYQYCFRRLSANICNQILSSSTSNKMMQPHQQPRVWQTRTAPRDSEARSPQLHQCWRRLAQGGVGSPLRRRRQPTASHRARHKQVLLCAGAERLCCTALLVHVLTPERCWLLACTRQVARARGCTWRRRSLV